MNEQTFFERRQPEWLQLMILCDKADRTPSDLSPAELKEMVRLYRRVSTDLSQVRTTSTNPGLITYLNDLAARSYGVLYRQPLKPMREILANAVLVAAQTVRRRRAFVFAAIFLFFGSTVGMFFLSSHSQELRSMFEQGGMGPVFQQWKTGKFDERSGSEGAMMTAFYASNNPRVSVIAGSVGAATFGLLSVYMIAQNGSIMGVLAAEMASVGRLDFLLSSVAPHSIPEVSGLLMAGAAGLLLGYSILVPGRRSRGDSLKAAGPDAIVLLSLSIALTLIAAPIEGFFSFNPRVPGFAKTAVALISLTAWIIFWTQYGRETDSVKREPAP